jgi:hypothetical protein
VRLLSPTDSFPPTTPPCRPLKLGTTRYSYPKRQDLSETYEWVLWIANPVLSGGRLPRNSWNPGPRIWKGGPQADRRLCIWNLFALH